LIGDRRRIKYKVIKNFVVAESGKRNKAGDDNDNKGY